MKRTIIKTPAQIGLGAAVAHLQQYLYDSIPWLEKSYGLASNGYMESTEKLTLTVPEVYMGNGRYRAVLPDGKNVSHAFFNADSGELVLEQEPYGDSKMSCDVSLVVWVNLDKVKREMGYAFEHRFTDELIEQVMTALSRYGDFKVERIEREARKVWAGWTIGRGVLYYGDQKEYAMTQIFKHPESGFRIHGTFYYEKPCI